MLLRAKKLTTKPFARPSDPDANITLERLGMRKNQNFEIVFWFKIGTAVLTSIFHFLPFPLFSFFLPCFVFFCWAFSRLHFGEKRFLESF